MMLQIIQIQSVERFINQKVASKQRRDYMYIQRRQTPINRENNKKLVKLIHQLLSQDESVPFRKPVAHKALGLDDYKDIVKKPIDLNLIRRQNNDGKYKFIEQALDDIHLCWYNAKLYNSSSSDLFQAAQHMEDKFLDSLHELFHENHYDLDREAINMELEAEKKKNEDKRNKTKKGQDLNGHSKSEAKLKKHSDPKHTKLEAHKSSKSEDVIPFGYTKVNFALTNRNRNKDSNRDIYKQENYDSKRQRDMKEMHQEEEGGQKKEEEEDSKLSAKQNEENQAKPEPIYVDLNENPSVEKLKALSCILEALGKKEEFGVLQKILEVLVLYEKENMKPSRGGFMTFTMEKIHISSYHRIRRILLDSQGHISELD